MKFCYGHSFVEGKQSHGSQAKLLFVFLFHGNNQ